MFHSVILIDNQVPLAHGSSALPSVLFSNSSNSAINISVSGPRVLPTSFFPSGSFSPSPRTVWRMEFDQPVSSLLLKLNHVLISLSHL